MKPALAELIEGGLALDPAERVRLADCMYDSLGENGEKSIMEEWAAEAERRDAEIDAGTANVAPWDKTMRELKARYVR